MAQSAAKQILSHRRVTKSAQLGFLFLYFCCFGSIVYLFVSSINFGRGDADWTAQDITFLSIICAFSTTALLGATKHHAELVSLGVAAAALLFYMALTIWMRMIYHTVRCLWGEEYDYPMTDKCRDKNYFNEHETKCNVMTSLIIMWMTTAPFLFLVTFWWTHDLWNDFKKQENEAMRSKENNPPTPNKDDKTDAERELRIIDASSMESILKLT